MHLSGKKGQDMTQDTAVAPKAPLGVGKIVSETFSTLFANFGKVILLGFLGAFLGFLLNFALLGFDAAIGSAGSEPAPGEVGGFVFGIIASMVVGMLIYAFATALLIQLAYDTKLGRSNPLSVYFRSAMPAVVPLAVLVLVISVLTGLGMILLVLPGLWVYAVFYVTAPVAVIERGGFGSMRRSASLTKQYRWPIVGLFVIVMIISVVVSIVATLAASSLGFMAGGAVGQIILGAVFSAINGFAYAVGGIATALTYARLREVKEGVAVDQIAAVFD